MTDALGTRHTARDVRLVVADVDGTLLTPGKILTSRARAAVQAVIEAGIAFTITSGRPPLGMKILMETLPLRHPISAFNGGLFVRSDVDREEWTVKFAPKVVPVFSEALDRVIKIVGVSDDADAMARCVEQVQRTFGRLLSAALSQPYYLDVTHPDANKGEVVRVLSELLGIPTRHVATIGDMPNDILMFERSGTSIAMANATEDVRRAATFVTAANTEEGFAQAMERFILRVPSA